MSPAEADTTAARLRELVEQPGQTATLWGVRYSITPRLCSRVFGDGQLALTISPLNTRPERYVVLADSSLWVGNAADGDLDEDKVLDGLDEMLDALEGDFGEAWHDRGDGSACADCCGSCEWCKAQVWPMVNSGAGTSWGCWGTVDEVVAQMAVDP